MYSFTAIKVVKFKLLYGPPLRGRIMRYTNCLPTVNLKTEHRTYSSNFSGEVTLNDE